mmetsp:Transcript_5711/g.12439  ORF Transcript_5711/g.12439 Transcript_5711/m.12439 type:complete len:218 (-) Transcript_5711:285-938(-)
MDGCSPAFQVRNSPCTIMAASCATLYPNLSPAICSGRPRIVRLCTITGAHICVLRCITPHHPRAHSFLLALELFLSYSEMRSDSPSERGPVLRQLAGSRILLIIFFAIILLLLCLRLDQGSVTWISIFWPFFVASGIYFCCCCCLCCALSLAPRPEARDVPPAESTSGGKAPPPTPSPTVLSAPSNCSGKAEEVPLLANQHGNYRTGGSILPAADAV